MGILSGLPGVRGDLEAEFASSVTGALDAIKHCRAVTGAGEHGAWSLWVDDDGMYRCEFCRFFRVMDSQIFRRKKDVRAWLRVWVPRVHRCPPWKGA